MGAREREREKNPETKHSCGAAITSEQHNEKNKIELTIITSII